MEWIKCSERMPDPHTKTLVWVPSNDYEIEGAMLADWYEHKGKAIWWCACHQTDPINPTHWRPLPKGPE